MKSRKTKSIFQWKLLVVLAFIILVGATPTHGQGDTKSAFETKADNFLKLYSANFDISTDIAGIAKELTPEKVPGFTWNRMSTLVSKATIQDKNGQTTNLKLYFSFYQFNDNNHCKAARDSILNCFGKNCVKIKWDVPVQNANTDPCVFIFNETEIISCQITCDQENDYWHRFTPDLVTSFRENTSTIMEAGCGGPVTFNMN